MKKYIALIIAMFSVCLLITGCGGAPKGTDSEVKETVIEIAKEQMLRFMMMNTYLRGLTIAEAEQKAQKDPSVRKVLDEQKAELAKMKLELVNIRVTKIDDKLKKSTNAADLQLEYKGETNKTPITYTAQLNDKGEVYVEVFGLQ